MGITGYQKVGVAVSEGTALEARALTKCAQRLSDALDTTDLVVLEEAVTQNQRLWLFFYSEIDSGNISLPTEVASNIVSLVSYVVKVAQRAYSGERKVLETLISINRNIAAGLIAGGGKAAPQPAQPQAQAEAKPSFSTSA
jgi:flagellar biosynthesis regulator FlaF